MNISRPSDLDEPAYARAAHLSLFSFILTFIASRTVVFLIMSHRIANLFLFLKGTHVHHLNYGIFLLSAVAGYLLYQRPEGRTADIAALFYGIAMALTFDEFGMWLHLGGGYWQRASVDAIIILAALFALLAFAPSLERLESRHLWGFVILIVVSIVFGVVILKTGDRIGHMVGPSLEALELSSTP